MSIQLLTRAILIAAFAIGTGAIVFAQQRTAPQPRQPATPKIDLGKVEYESKCATCHGLKGKGDGPTAAYLTRKAADLTTMAKRNNGILPVASMYEIIDGSKAVPAHGSRDMPVWGTAYRIQAGEYFLDVPYDSEAYVRARILTVIEYIDRLQVK